MTAQHGRMYEPELTALARVAKGRVELRAPRVGLWREAPVPGTLIRPGTELGRLEVLGVLHRLIAPDQAYGIVLGADQLALDAQHGDDDGDTDGDSDASANANADIAARSPAQAERARRPVGYGDRLLVLDPEAVSAGPIDEATEEADGARSGLLFRAPTSGRFYGRPGPDRPSFVHVGDIIEEGQTVCLLEVMKTFNRVTYGGKGLPACARVAEILPGNEDDLSAGDVILVLAPDDDTASTQ